MHCLWCYFCTIVVIDHGQPWSPSPPPSGQIKECILSLIHIRYSFLKTLIMIKLFWNRTAKKVLSFRSNLRDKTGIDTGSKEKKQEPKYQKLYDKHANNKHSKLTNTLLHVKEKWKQFTSVVLGSNTSVSAAAGCTSSVWRGRKNRKRTLSI